MCVRVSVANKCSKFENMQKSFGLIVTVLVILFGIFSYSVKNYNQGTSSLRFDDGDQIETFTLPNMQTESVSLDSVITSHKLTWVNFWATWCGPCRREMPMMAELYNKFKDKGLAIVAISVGEKHSTVAQYLSNNPVPFTILTDVDGSIATQFKIKALPTSFLVDSTGTILQSGVGIQNYWPYYIERDLTADEDE